MKTAIIKIGVADRCLPPAAAFGCVSLAAEFTKA